MSSADKDGGTRKGSITVEVLEVTGLGGGDDISPYVIMKVGWKSHTTPAKHGVPLQWKGSEFTFDILLSSDQEIVFEVWDKRRLALDTLLGRASLVIPMEHSEHTNWLKLSDPNTSNADGALRYNIRINTPLPSGSVGVIKHQDEESKSLISSVINDLKTLGWDGAEETAQVLMETILHGNSYTDDRKGGLDKLIHTMSRLPASSKLLHKLEQTFISSLWADIIKPPRVLAGDYFRSADGSRNSLLYPDVGKSGTHYARTVTEVRTRVPTLPSPGDIFDLLFDRGDKFIPHPNNISVMLFYFATLITHDLFFSDPRDSTINSTTHYLDLSPLYGRNKIEQDKVRMGHDGLLKPDAFSELRLALQPQGVAALLVVFSRNHNYIAAQLKRLNEGGRFSNVSPTGLKVSDEHLDHKLFETARLINTGCYLNLILHDYLHAILGLESDSVWFLNPRTVPPASNPTGGNQNAIEFNLVYRWHSAIGQADAQWSKDLIDDYMKLISQHNDSHMREKPLSFEEILRKLTRIPDGDPQWSLGTPIRGLKRQEDGSFDTRELGKIFEHAIEQVAGKPGASHIPSHFKIIEEAAIYQGRKANTCTLNAFRKHLKLAPHQSFRDLNPDPEVYKALKQLYDNVDDVELYVGLVAEESKTFGLGLQYTTSRAIISDAVNLLRNDRFFMDDYTPDNLTSWGYRFAEGDPSVNGGSIMHSLLLLHVPQYFQPDSPYVWNAFHVPKPDTPKPSDYVSPIVSTVKISDFQGVTDVLKNHQSFHVTHTRKMEAVTNGYGNVLAWSDTPRYKRDLAIMHKVLHADDAQMLFDWAFNITELLLKKKSCGKGIHQSIDAVAKLARPIPTLMVSHYFGVTVREDKPKTDKLSEKYVDSAQMESWLNTLYHWIFLDAQPEDSVVLGKRAIQAGSNLESYILGLIKLRRDNNIKDDTVLGRYLNQQASSAHQEEDGLTDKIITYEIMSMIVGATGKLSKSVALVLEHLLKADNKDVLSNLSAETDNKKIEKYVLEAMRLNTPTPTLLRVAVNDDVVHSERKEIPVKANQFILMDLAAAMLDPAAFPDPLVFKTDRPSDLYLPFGFAFHRCVGRSPALAVICGIVRALGGKTHLRAVSAQVGYLTYEAEVSPYPQTYIVKYEKTRMIN